MSVYQKIGIGLIIAGIAMFFLGASMFSYRGEVNAFISKLGMLSFILWLPTIIVGIILLFIRKRKISR